MSDLNHMSRSGLIAEFQRLKERIKELEHNDRQLRSELDDALSSNQQIARETEVLRRELQEHETMEIEYNEMKALAETLTEENKFFNAVYDPTPETSFILTPEMLTPAITTLGTPYARRTILPPITVSPATTQNSTMNVTDSATVPKKMQEIEMSSAAPSKSKISDSLQKRIPPSAPPTDTTSKSTMQPSDFVKKTTPHVSSANSTISVSAKAKVPHASSPHTSMEQFESLYGSTASETAVKSYHSDLVHKTSASSAHPTLRVSDRAQRMSSSAFPSSIKKRTDSSMAEKSTQPLCAPEPSVITSPKMPSASSANSTMQLPDSGLPQRKTSSTSTPNSTLQKCNSVMISLKVTSVSTTAASAQPSGADMVQRTSDSSANATMRVSDSAQKMSSSGFPSSMKKRSDSTLTQKNMSPPSTPAKMPSTSTPEFVQNRMTPASSVNLTMQLPESNLTSSKMPPAGFPTSMKKTSDFVLPQTSSTSTPNSTIQPSNSVIASPKVPSASTPRMGDRRSVSSANSTLQLPESILASTQILSTSVPQKQSAEYLHTSFPANNTLSASASTAIVKEEFNPFFSRVEQTGPPPPPPRSTSIRSELSDSSMSSTSSDETETKETTNIQVQPRPIVLRSFAAPQKPRPATSPLYTDYDGMDSQASYKRGRSFNSEFDDASPRSSAAFARTVNDRLDNRSPAQRERNLDRKFDNASSSAAVAKNVNDHLDNKSPSKRELNFDDATIGGSLASFSDVEYTNNEYDDNVPNTDMHNSVDNGNATLQEMKEDNDVPSTNTTMRPSVINDSSAALPKKKQNKATFDRYYISSDEEDHPSPAWYG